MKDKTSKIDINSTVLDTPSVFDKWAKWGIMLLGMLLYANTLGHEYTQDDAIVIYDNMYTVKGVAGIPGILSKDTFYGFFKEAGKEKLVYPHHVCYRISNFWQKSVYWAFYKYDFIWLTRLVNF
jgi:hypothetical protein